MKQLHYLHEIETDIRRLYGLSWPMDTLILNKELIINVDLRDTCFYYIMDGYI
jgi:hypothetical protein